MSSASGAESAPQAVDVGPDPLEELWWLLPLQPLAQDPGSCLDPGEPLLRPLLPASILPPAGLQGACELPSTGDAGPGGHFRGMFSPLGQSLGCCRVVGIPPVP